MSIKLLARDLYRYQKEVERLEGKLAAAAAHDRVRLEEKLRIARAKREQLRRALDGRLQR